ncbi:MAG: ribonuclease [Fusobacteriaceae bacterium]|jgi:ribonuclease G|nr:RNAse [Fusobacteriales bacterium]MDN5304672.1 ribonuclease [Fusobacteriaceae bacterium]
MKQIIVSVKDFESNAALIEDNKLVEFLVERDDLTRIVGNIYKGKVENVLPGMESAFINIGLEKNAFLYVNDLREFEERYLDGVENSDRPIEDILKKDDEVVVQILKDPRGNKGARVTTHYTIPGKYLVLMPNNNYIGISKKIKDENERKRLHDLIEKIKPENVGLIIRTEAEGKEDIYFEREIEYLVKKWQEIEYNISRAKIGEILYSDNDLVNRVVRDIFSHEIDELVIDNEKKYWEIIDYINAFSEKEMSTKIKLFNEEEDILDYYKVRQEVEKALKKEVWLDCGGYLVIEKTEALISIDVNTGKNIGLHNLEETVFQTNLEAAREIPRQLRLRNLSGIIIIDFIDMRVEEDKEKVLAELEKNLSKDRVKNNIIHFTDLGLIEMTRKRVGKPLSNYFLEECYLCKGNGHVRSVEAIAHEIIEQIKKDAKENDINKIKILASERVYEIINSTYKEFIITYLKSKNKNFELEKLNKPNFNDYEVIYEK